ncbi:MAG: hypothetical protein HQ477_09340 [Chloroflexi bacterium]|nr:hypothetical protein [Chloroflexota bacterium]
MKSFRTSNPYLLSMAIAVIAVLAVISCSSTKPDEIKPVVDVIREPTPTPVVTKENGLTRVVVHLSPTDGEGQFGTATLASNVSTTTIKISIKPPAVEAQPIHIHSGECTDVGPVLHALQNVVKGYSVTIINIPLTEIVKDGALVNIHASYSDASNYTACGQLPYELP